MGSEDPLQIFLKGIFVQEGSSGTRFDHGQFEIKTFRGVKQTWGSRGQCPGWGSGGRAPWWGSGGKVP